MQDFNEALSASLRVKMLAAKWLEKAAPGENVEAALKWSSLGLRRTLLLRHIIMEFNLSKDVSAVVRFTLLAKDGNQPRSRAGDPSHGFWISCLEELALDWDEGSLRSLVETVWKCDELSSHTPAGQTHAFQR